MIVLPRVVQVSRAPATEHPFHPRASRKLRITLDDTMPADIVEAEHLALLRELAHVELIDAADMVKGLLPFLEVDHEKLLGPLHDQHVAAHVTGKDFRKDAIEDWAGWEATRQRLFAGSTASDIEAALRSAAAHTALRHDLLVTSSRVLLDHRSTPEFTEANIVRPIEALKLVALFLRGRGNFTIRAGDWYTELLSPDDFYWVLARCGLPDLWRYVSACVYSNPGQHAGLSLLAQSILSRCQRGCVAAEAIARLYQLPQDQLVIRDALYHFDYLLLLLSGALDAQARVVNSIYRLATGPRDAGFRRKEFLKELRKNAERELLELLDDERTRAVLQILGAVRNTIHGAQPWPLIAEARGAISGLAMLDGPEGEEVWDSAFTLGGPQHWGLRRLARNVCIDPYCFAVTILNETFALVNGIGQATDVTRLAINAPTALPEGSPGTPPFDNNTMKRIAMLG